MKLSEYIEAVETPLEAGKSRDINMSDLYGHFKAKHFTPENVLEFYRQRDSPKFIALVQKYEAGKLFAAQMQSWPNWTAHDYQREDKVVAETFLSIEQSAQQHHAKIRHFIFTRVYGSRASDDKANEKWCKDNLTFGWRWNT